MLFCHRIVALLPADPDRSLGCDEIVEEKDVKRHAFVHQVRSQPIQSPAITCERCGSERKLHFTKAASSHGIVAHTWPRRLATLRISAFGPLFASSDPSTGSEYLTGKEAPLTTITALAGGLTSGTAVSQRPVSDSRREDADLAARVSRGDRDSLETVFQQYGGAVKSIALRVLRDETLAEDVVQEVYLGFWKSPDKYNPKLGTLRTFLITMAHRRAVDIVRSEESRFRREERVPKDVAPSIDEEVWARSLSDSVKSALEALNEGEREAITLAYFGGFSYVEVAAKLGTPEGTVKSRIRSGMKKLSVSLAGLTP